MRNQDSTVHRFVVMPSWVPGGLMDSVVLWIVLLLVALLVLGGAIIALQSKRRAGSVKAGRASSDGRR